MVVLGVLGVKIPFTAEFLGGVFLKKHVFCVFWGFAYCDPRWNFKKFQFWVSVFTWALPFTFWNFVFCVF